MCAVALVNNSVTCCLGSTFVSMRIAVTAIFLNSGPLEGYGHYSKELLRQLLNLETEHTFLFLYDRPLLEPPFLHPRVTHRVVGPATRQPFSQALWYHVKAAWVVRRWQADVWLQPYGFASFFSTTPQTLIVHDLAPFHLPGDLPWYHRWHYRLFTKTALKKAKTLADVSQTTRTDLQQLFPFSANRPIALLPGAPREGFHPLDWEEKKAVKEQYTGGHEYLLVAGSIHPRKNLLTVLKAFSLFKKWQKTNMKLVIVGRWAWQNEGLQEKLKTYKYRDDLVITGYVADEVLFRLTGAAYTLIYPSRLEGFGLPLLEAMQSGVPVIASDHPALRETGGDAAIYFAAEKPEELYEQCLRLYKDEQLKKQLIDAGHQQAARYSWHTTAIALNELLQKTGAAKE